MSLISRLIVVSAFVYAVVILAIVFAKRSPLVVWSVWLYRLLLAAYPAAFREEYGPEMIQVFRDTMRDEHRRRGLWGLLMVWLRTLADFSVSVVRQHREQAAHAEKVVAEKARPCEQRSRPAARSGAAVASVRRRRLLRDHLLGMVWLAPSSPVFRARRPRLGDSHHPRFRIVDLELL